MYDKVTCPICNKQLTKINNAHLRSHGLNYWTFKEQYPEALIESTELRKTYGSQSKESRQKIKETTNAKKQKRVDEYNASPKLCKQCGSPIPYDHRHDSFCSLSCKATYVNLTRTLTAEGKHNVKQAAKLNKDRLFQYTLKRIENHPPQCKVFTKTCVTCNRLFLSKSKLTLNCSKLCKSKHHAIYNHKQNKTRGKCGYYKGIWCASTWELAFVVYCLDHQLPIIRCDKRYVYTFEHKQKYYFPDFMIEGIIYEVKGRMTADVSYKTQSVVDAGDDIIIIGKNEIKPYIEYVKQHYQVKELTNLYQ